MPYRRLTLLPFNPLHKIVPPKHEMVVSKQRIPFKPVSELLIVGIVTVVTAVNIIAHLAQVSNSTFYNAAIHLSHDILK